jgi:fructose-1,6-bisphosphatase/inositol monophosphatase family enzyme
MAVAAKGQGVTLDGKPIRPEAKRRPPSGYIGFKVRKEFDRQLPPAQRRLLGNLTSLNCAGREYIEILAGHRDFSLYRRTKPWDHAAGALMVTEGGGEAQRFNGAPYDPAGSMDGGIITAVSRQVLAEIRAIFEAVQMPLLAPRS